MEEWTPPRRHRRTTSFTVLARVSILGTHPVDQPRAPLSAALHVPDPRRIPENPLRYISARQTISEKSGKSPSEGGCR